MMRERTVNVARRCLMLRCAGGVLKTTRPARLVIPCQSLGNCFTAYCRLPREIFAAPVQLESLRGLASDCRCQGREDICKRMPKGERQRAPSLLLLNGDQFRSCGVTINVRFSNRPVWVKRFQTIHCCSVDVARGLVLLSGIGSWALPSWGSRTGWTNLLGGLAVGLTVGPADIAISPHPSSREGHHATAWWSSRFSYRVWLYTALTLQRCFCSSGTRCHQPRCGA